MKKRYHNRYKDNALVALVILAIAALVWLVRELWRWLAGWF